MRVRLIIAALTGAVVGLVVLAVVQARNLAEARRLLAAGLPAPDLPASTNQRPLRLRLQSLPPLNVRTEVRALDWRSIESDDYAVYIANLRATGCPEETIRDIIIADVNKLYASRRNALAAPRPDWAFWLHPDELPDDDALARSDREYDAQLAALDRERRALLQTLLGDSAVQAELAEYTTEAATDRDLRFLPADKRQAIAEATARWRLAREVALGSVDDAEATRLRTAADKAFEESLATALTPAERENYEMRTSPLAHELRERLRGFGASKEEFEQLFRMERQLAEDRAAWREAGISGSDPQAAEKQEAAEIEHQDRVREFLGAERYADLERANDPDFQTLFSLAKDHAVPTELAKQVWGMRQEVANQSDRVRQNPFLSAEQKTRALDAIRSETQAAIVDVLGEPLLDEYQRQGGGWLIDLTDPTDLGETGRELVPPPLPGIQEGAADIGFLPPP